MTTDYKILSNLKTEISNLPSQESIYFRCIQQFSGFTKTMITQGKLDIARRCFKVAEKVFTKGDETIKLAMLNFFLCSLSLTITGYHCEKMLPAVLQSELQNIRVNINSEIVRDNIAEY